MAVSSELVEWAAHKEHVPILRALNRWRQRQEGASGGRVAKYKEAVDHLSSSVVSVACMLPGVYTLLVKVAAWGGNLQPVYSKNGYSEALDFQNYI
jgi:hypothetical protein